MKLKFLIGPSFLLDLETGFHHVMSPPSSSSVPAGHKLGNRRVTNYDGLPEKKRFPVGDGGGGDTGLSVLTPGMSQSQQTKMSGSP